LLPPYFSADLAVTDMAAVGKLFCNRVLSQKLCEPQELWAG